MKIAGQGAPGEPIPPRRRSPWLWVALGAGVVLLVVVAVVATALIVGGQSDDSSSAAATSRTWTTTTATTTPPADDGPLALGEETTLTGSGTEILTYAVTSIVEGEQNCPGTVYNEIENGHLLVVGMKVTTTAAFDPDNYSTVLSPYKGGWTIVGPDGITETGITSAAAYGCTDDQIPRDFARSSTYQYKISFDTRNTTGLLKYSVGQAMSSWRF